MILFLALLHFFTPLQQAAIDAIDARFENHAMWMQPGKERWEFDQRFEERKDELWPLFIQAGLIDEVLPLESEYDYLLIHGGVMASMKLRIAFALRLWESGVRFRSAVFLSGYRPLQPFEQGGAFQTEVEAARALCQSLPFSVEMIDAPADEWPRATTADTVRAWLKTNPTPGRCLAVSNQPYVLYQDFVLCRYLPDSFALETVGPAMEKGSVALVLDSLERTLRQKNI